jgi:hypothetical protein
VRFALDAPLGTGSLRRLTTLARSTWGADVVPASGAQSLDDHFDTATVAALASAVLQLVGVVVQLSQSRRPERSDIDRVQRAVRAEVREAYGTGRVTDLRYESLLEFLAGTSASCQVVAEIDDELHLFIVDRDASFVSIRYEP